MKKNTEALLKASREVGLEVNTKKTKYTAMSHHQSSRENHNLLIANNSFENVTNFKYLKQQYQIKIALMKKLRSD
jgi:hypothetical protein